MKETNKKKLQYNSTFSHASFYLKEGCYEVRLSVLLTLVNFQS